MSFPIRMVYKCKVQSMDIKKVARCNLCKKDLSTMGSCALDSHASGKKHKEKVKEREQSLDAFFKSKPAAPSIVNNVSMQSDASSSSIEKKQVNLVESLSINDTTVNSEILWTLKVINSHFSFRSCIDLNKNFL